MTKKRRLGLMPRWQRLLTWISLALCALSGSAYLIGHEFNVLVQQFGNHSILVVHGVSAALVIFILGAVATVHIKAGLVARKNLISGFTQLVALVLLFATGLLLYYGSEEIRELTILSHWIFGLIFTPIFLFHATKRLRV